MAGTGGNPDDPTYGHGREQWLDDMQVLGSLPNVVCKISGVVARAAPAGAPPTWRPRSTTVSTASARTGIVFGSDWPVCTFAASLGEWITALREIVSGRSERLRHKLLHENAERIYGLA